VGEAENGLEAVELFKSGLPDIAFLDIRLPGLSGLEAARKLKQLSPSAKIIIVTAYQEFDYVHEALQLGASDFLLKPYLYKDILPILEKVVEEIRRSRKEMEEEEKLKEQLAGALPYILLSFAHDLLSGTLTADDYENICARANFLGIYPLPSQVMLADINGFAEMTAEQSEIRKQYLKNSVFQAIKSVTDENNALLYPENDDHFVILFATPIEDNFNRAHQLAEKIRSAVEQSTEATVTIGIGRRYDPLSLRFSYREAREAQGLGSFFLGANAVVSIDQLDNVKIDIDDNHLAQMEMTLLEAVRYGDKQRATRTGRELLKTLLTYTDSPGLDAVKIRMTELLILISRHTIDGGQFKQLAAMNLSYLRKLAHLKDVNSTIEWLESVITSYIDVNYNDTGKPSQAVRRAIQYIREHFANKLTLEEISKIVFLNPYYFSRVFKHETGHTFIEYLTNIRMEHAMSLLVSSKMSINAVSRSVGYDDPNYFARLFSRKFGVTPREYRQGNGGRTMAQ